MVEKRKSSKPGEHTVRLTISLDDSQKAGVKTTSGRKRDGESKPLFVDEADLLKLANLSKKAGERNTEHGKTRIQIIEFRDASQRRKIIRMLVDHYSEILWKLLPYFRNLGGHPRAEIRKRVSETVGELMCEDFIRVKDDVLLRWAMHGSAMVNANVGLALAIVAKDKDARYAENVKSLLHHWVTIPNPNLNWTGLASCVSLCSLWPEEVLGYIKKSLRRGRVELLALSFFVIRELCRTGNTEAVLSHLSDWIGQNKEEQSIRTGAAIIFLDTIEISDVIGKKALLKSVVDIFLTGLEDNSLDNEGMYRSLALEKLHGWLQSTADDKNKMTSAEKLFLDLYRRSNERGRNRLEFNLPRWSNTSEGKDAKIYQRLVKALDI